MDTHFRANTCHPERADIRRKNCHDAGGSLSGREAPTYDKKESGKDNSSQDLNLPISSKYGSMTIEGVSYFSYCPASTVAQISLSPYNKHGLS